MCYTPPSDSQEGWMSCLPWRKSTELELLRLTATSRQVSNYLNDTSRKESNYLNDSHVPEGKQLFA